MICLENFLFEGDSFPYLALNNTREGVVRGRVGIVKTSRELVGLATTYTYIHILLIIITSSNTKKYKATKYNGRASKFEA